MLYRIIYEDGHAGEARTWESLLYLIRAGRRWRKYGVATMIPVRVEHVPEKPLVWIFPPATLDA